MKRLQDKVRLITGAVLEVCGGLTV